MRQASANDCLSKTAFLLTTSRGSADPSLDNYARGAKIFEDVCCAGFGLFFWFLV